MSSTNFITFILLAIIVIVILIDQYQRRKKKLATSTNIEKESVNKDSSNKRFGNIALVLLVSVLILTASFFALDHFEFDGKLTDKEDGISLLQNLTEKKYNISEINFVGDSIYKFVGDSMYKFNDITNANGLIYCQYGNIGMLINGKPDGLWTLYHPNGTKKMRVLLINGKQEGIRTDWYNDTQMKFRGNYSNDKQTGLSEFWFKNGQKELEGVFAHGGLRGDYTRWYNDGSVKYIYNHQEKTYKEYWDNGAIYCDAHSVQHPSSPLSNRYESNPYSVIEVHADFYSKDGELINKLPYSLYGKPPKNVYRNKYSGRPCKSYRITTDCTFYWYYLNGDVKGMMYDTYDGIEVTKNFYENGKIEQISNTGNDRTITTYKRNGKIHSKFNNKTEEYSCYEEGHLISNDAFCHSGLDKRLFQKKSELNWRPR